MDDRPISFLGLTVIIINESEVIGRGFKVRYCLSRWTNFGQVTSIHSHGFRRRVTEASFNANVRFENYTYAVKRLP